MFLDRGICLTLRTPELTDDQRNHETEKADAKKDLRDWFFHVFFQSHLVILKTLEDINICYYPPRKQ